MEPVPTSGQTEVEVLDGIESNTLNPLGISDGKNTQNGVKTEEGECLEIGGEFEAEPDESGVQIYSESMPWMKHADWFKVPMKQELGETDSEAALRKRFGCEREPVIRTERLNLKKLPQCSTVEFEGRKQLLAQIPTVACPELHTETGWPLRSMCQRSSGVIIRDEMNSAEGKDSSQDLDEPQLKPVAVTDSGCSAQSRASDFHPGTHSTRCQQNNLLGNSQALDEAESVHKSGALPSESSGVLLTGPINKNHYTLQTGQKTEFLDTTFNGCRNGEKFFNCCLCSRKFARRSYLNKHKKIHTAGKIFQCRACRKQFTERSHLTSHVKMHAGEKCFECSVCKKKFTLYSSLTQHANLHTGEKRFECSECGKKFAQKSYLIAHFKYHTDEKPYECSVCRKKFILKSVLNRHLTTHAGKKPFECSVCRKTFSQKFYLSEHVKIHSSEKPFECSVCGKRFAYKSYLTKHLVIHTGKKPYECSACGKTFPLQSYLTSHTKSHSADRKFECGVCRKKFKKRCVLIAHIKIHMDEKPFECSVCQKRFIQKSHLTTHAKIHTGEKPFGCSICRKSFVLKSNLSQHVKIHGVKKLPECTVQIGSYLENHSPLGSKS